MKKILIILCFVLSVIMPHAVLGANLTVGTGESYISIQDALDAAENGDTVIIEDGIYTGSRNKNLNFNKKSLTLKSRNGPENCILDCQKDGQGIYFYKEGSNDIVDGLTIQNGKIYNQGGAIRCVLSSPTIRDCIFKNNIARTGGGICCVNASPIIENCKIIGNYTNVGGGGVYSYTGAPILKNCIISNNHTQAYGGGIHIDRQSMIKISNTIIEGNRGDLGGGGIYGTNASVPTITNCDIINNTTKKYGGGLYLYYSSAVIKDCIIKNNVAEKVGGICSFKGSSPTITNCIIAHNTSSMYAGGIMFYRSTPTPSSLVNNTICNNTGGGITFKFGPDVSIKNCIIWGNGSYQLSETGYDVTYSLVGDGVYGAPEDHNISGNPSFVDGYHLGVGSPCIGAGIDAGAPDDDIEGHARSIPPCIGAYESTQPCLQKVLMLHLKK